MDEGYRISYQVLEVGVPIYASDGQQVGIVEHVVAAVREDIFHGIVMRTGELQLFVPADEVAELHERGVDLRIDATAAGTLEAPAGEAPAYEVNQPGVKPSAWSEILDLFGGHRPHDRDWRSDR
jgi:hypothetical protein